MHSRSDHVEGYRQLTAFATHATHRQLAHLELRLDQRWARCKDRIRIVNDTGRRPTAQGLCREPTLDLKPGTACSPLPSHEGRLLATQTSPATGLFTVPRLWARDGGCTPASGRRAMRRPANRRPHAAARPRLGGVELAPRHR